MASGLRRRAARGFFLLMVPFLLCACSKKQVIRDDPPRAAVVEALVFLSAVQGNPVCMAIDINKHRSSSLFSSPKTKWRMNGWLLSPGLATYLGSQKGKSKQGNQYRDSNASPWVHAWRSATSLPWPFFSEIK